jgi:hypothetical protein
VTPGEIRVSFSSTKRFRECEMQEYLIRNGAPRLPFRPERYLVGNVVHRGIRKIHLDGTPLTGGLVFNLFATELERNPAIRVSHADMRVMIEKAVYILQQFTAHVQMLMNGLGEKGQAFLEKTFEVPSPNCNAQVLVKPDLLISYGAREVTIWDYKTGLSKPDADQLVYYGGVVRRMFVLAEQPKPNLRLVYLLPNPDGEAPVRHEVTYTEERFARQMIFVRDVYQTLTGIREPEPSPTPAKCSVCAVRRSCRFSASRPQGRGRSMLSSRVL